MSRRSGLCIQKDLLDSSVYLIIGPIGVFLFDWHISKCADTFVTDPKKHVQVGQVVKVRVLEVDADLKRISLSMKSGDGHAHAHPHPHSEPSSKQEPRDKKPPQPVNTKQALADKYKKEDSHKLKTVKPKFNIRQFMK